MAFSCADVGSNTVQLTVVDVNNNSAESECTDSVLVVDQIAPEAVCQDVTVELTNTNVATITPSQIDNGSSDNW